MERHARHASHVDADRRQDTARACPNGEPLVAGAALRLCARAHDVVDAVRHARLLGGVRFHRPRSPDTARRWTHVDNGARAALRCGILPGLHGRIALARPRRPHLARASGDRKPDPRSRATRRTRRTMPQPRTISGARSRRPRACSHLSRPLHWQDEPGAFFLGELRPRMHALQRRARTTTSGRRSRTRRLGDPRGVLARLYQRGMVARRLGEPRGGASVLRVRLSRARRLPDREDSTRRRLLPRRDARVDSAIRGRSGQRQSRRRRAQFLPEYLRSRGNPRRVGSRDARARRRPLRG